MVRDKIIKNFSINTLFIVNTAVINLLGVPILLKYWGVEYYGEWLLLSTIPTYLGLSDFGIGAAVITELTILKSENKIHEATRLYNTAFYIIVGLATIILLSFYLTTFIISYKDALNIKIITDSEFNLSFGLLLLYSYFSLVIISLPHGLYRIFDKYSKGQLILLLFRFLEFLALIFLVVLNAKLSIIALTFLLLKVSQILYIFFDTYRNKTYFKIEKPSFDIEHFKTIVKPSLSVSLIHLAQNIILTQGTTTVVGITLGSSKVAFFNSVRTLLNMIKQANSVISLSFIPEFTYAYGGKNLTLLRDLLKKSNFLLYFVSISLFLFLFFFGEKIFNIWTNNKMLCEQPFFNLTLLSLLTYCIWFGRLNFLLAINKHTRTGFFYLLLALIFVITLKYGIIAFGLSALPVMQMAMEIILSFIIVKEVSKTIN